RHTRWPRDWSSDVCSSDLAFILDGDHVRVTRDEEKLGLNSSITNDLVVEGAVVKRDRLLHEEGKGFRVAMATLDGGRIGIAAQEIGRASCRERGLVWADDG